MSYSDKTWAAFAAADKNLVPRLARRHARGQRSLQLRLEDAGRDRLLGCLSGVATRSGATDRYDESSGVAFSTFAYRRLQTAMQVAANRTRDDRRYGKQTRRLLYGDGIGE